jgi:predicted nucleotidyltransferase
VGLSAAEAVDCGVTVESHHNPVAYVWTYDKLEPELLCNKEINMHPLINIHRDKLSELCTRHHVRRLELFGSAVDDSRADAIGDFDFLVEFLPVLPGEHSRAYFGLLFDLEDTLKKPVDLIESPAVTNHYFLRNIQSSRKVLYAV